MVSFDNIEEVERVNPPLTTVDSHSQELVRSVVSCLLQRMENPERLRNVVYVDSEIIYRQSTRI